MVLGFKTQFVPKILGGSKIHTIREDKMNRWQKGVKIHFATGVRTKNYAQFMEGVCCFNQAVILCPERQEILLGLNGQMHLLDISKNLTFAQNDGFDTEQDFWGWFNKPFMGVVIHWTQFVYR